MSRSPLSVLGFIASFLCIVLFFVYITNPGGIAENVPMIWRSTWAVAIATSLAVMIFGRKRRPAQERPVKIGRF